MSMSRVRDTLVRDARTRATFVRGTTRRSEWGHNHCTVGPYQCRCTRFVRDDSFVSAIRMDQVSELANIRIRTGTVADYERIGRLHASVYGVPRSGTHMDWLYDQNPAGRCRLWVAEDAHSGEIVSTRPVFPWRVRIAGRDVLAAQAGDAMTDPRYRNRGVFGALVRTAWSALREEGIPFVFSFSNPGSLAVYRKIAAEGGTTSAGNLLSFRRLTYPLSIRALVDRVPTLHKAAALERVARRLLRRRLRPLAGYTAERVSRFDEEVDRLWERVADRYGVMTVRTHTHLNWRYLRAPSGPFDAILLRHEGRPVAYIIFEAGSDGHAAIADLFAPPDGAIIAELLKACLGALLDRAAVAVSVHAAEGSPFSAALRRFGFVPRADRAPFAVHALRECADAETALQADRWLLWYGDRDVERVAVSRAPSVLMPDVPQTDVVRAG
jgi:predicted N-acetyltransferase YhbS